MLPESDGRRIDHAIVGQLERMGAQADVLAAAGERARANDEDAFEIWPDNEDAVVLFVRLSTQWRYGGGMIAMRTGLDYAAIRPVAGLLRLRVTPALFADLQTMESAALEALAERQEREAARAGRSGA